VRAIHINPWARTIREIELLDDGEGGVDYGALRQTVFSGRRHCLGHLDHALLADGTAAFFDAEGHAIPHEEQRFSHWGDEGPTWAGHVVLISMDAWGNTGPLTLPLDAVLAQLHWADVSPVTFVGLCPSCNGHELSGGRVCEWCGGAGFVSRESYEEFGRQYQQGEIDSAQSQAAFPA